MIKFPAYPACEACPLSATATRPGLPTRRASLPPPVPAVHDTAVLCVGEGPGYTEDRDGAVWVGASGKLLHHIVTTARLHTVADIFLGNMTRCRPPRGSNPTDGQCRTCSRKLEADLAILRDHYDRVVVICFGAKAARIASHHKTLKDALTTQGHIHDIFGYDTQVFFTSHPARVLRDPTVIRSVGHHMDLAHQVLSGTRTIAERVVFPTRAPNPPSPFPREICLDIETYGILKGVSQTVFHPARSAAVDGCPLGSQIVTVQIAYEKQQTEQSETAYESAVFVWSSRHDRLRLYKWLRRARTILGQNIPFDILYLRMNDIVCRQLLTPELVALDDVGVINHLDFEQRPERGLKPLSELFGVASYADMEVTGALGTATSAYDPRLWRYGATDVVAPLRLKKVLMDRIRTRCGPTSSKLSKTCTDFRSTLLWSVLDLSEQGFGMDEAALRAVHTTHTEAAASIAAHALATHDLVLTGEGSAASRRAAVEAALDSDLIDDARVKLTKKRKDISFSKENINFILEMRDDDDPRIAPILLMRDFNSHNTITTHYTSKLLEDPRKGTTPGPSTGVLMAYPSWYAIPSKWGKDAASEEERGTIQGRITCTRPGAQTFPKPIKSCICSRYPGGVLVWADESQIELRVAAMLTGDPVLCETYRSDEDIHGNLALRMFPDIPTDDPLWHDVYRQAAKRANFLMIYLGGPETLHSHIRKDVGHLVDVDSLFPLPKCHHLIQVTRDMYRGYFQNVEDAIGQAGRTGFLETPTGFGRTFLGGPSAVRSTYSNEISNIRVQCLAAQLTISAHVECLRVLKAHGFSSHVSIGLNVYDALLFDCKPGVVEDVLSLIEKPLTEPPLLPILHEELGNRVPLRYDVEVAGGNGNKNRGENREADGKTDGKTDGETDGETDGSHRSD